MHGSGGEGVRWCMRGGSGVCTGCGPGMWKCGRKCKCAWRRLLDSAVCSPGFSCRWEQTSFQHSPLPTEPFLPRVSPWLAQRSVPVTTTKTLHPPQTAPPPPLSPPRPPLQTPPRAGRPPGPHSPPTASSPSLPVRLTLLSTRPALCPLRPVPSRGASVVQE